ncbi:MAG: heme exporter protein CcmB [Anaerolineales bacterium]
MALSESTTNVKTAKPSFLRAVFAVVQKDLTAEYRSRELVSAMMVFAVLVIFIFNYALNLEPDLRKKVTAGVLWVTFTFAGNIGLNRAMAAEKDRGCLDGLLLAPVDRAAIYFGKAISTLIFMLLVEVIVLPLYGFFYNVNLFKPGLFLIILLGSVGYTSVGTLLSSMAVQTRTRDILLPIILFPITIPIVLAAVDASGKFLTGAPMSDIQPALTLLIALDVIFTSIAFMVFDYVVEE